MATGPGELTGKPTRITYFSDQSHAQLGSICYDVMGRGETFISEIVHRRRNGDPVWMRITGRAIDPAHPNDGSIWNFEDITSRKVAEDSLRESVMLQRAILDSAKLMILSTDNLRADRFLQSGHRTDAGLFECRTDRPDTRRPLPAWRTGRAIAC